MAKDKSSNNHVVIELKKSQTSDDTVGQVAKTEEGQKAIQLDLAEKAIEAKHAIAKDSTVVLLPDGDSNAATVSEEESERLEELGDELAAEKKSSGEKSSSEKSSSKPGNPIRRRGRR